ncbi:MAG TPA: hypothetical protein VKV02_01820 [Acidobacteriaceae bacterium]|nr:hypothetical protein [Acidobacteriaceae bacterium]
MPSAAALRLQIETALGSRIPGALTPRPRAIRDLAATGIPELDTLLEGGFPIGAITELVGPLSSGRTTLAMAALAEMTQAGKTVAWIDVSDALDPESAAAAGIDLSRQLWVRCGGNPACDSKSLYTSAPTSSGGAALLVHGNRTPASSGGCGSPHPRGEARGMSQAIDAFLQHDAFSRQLPPRHGGNPGRRDRTLGTPGAPNRKLLPQKPLDRTPQDPRPIPRRARDREEQIPTDRQPSRRQIAISQQHDKAKSLQSAQIAHTAAVARSRPQAGHWTDNNTAGRAIQTIPNAIAAGLPRFREMEARAQKAERSSADKQVPQVSRLKPGATEAPHITESATQCKTSLAGDPPPSLGKFTSPLWRALDQALRATDLLLAAGGFSAVVLDLGSTPPEFAWRIPLATWFRFRAAADRARTVLLVLTQHPCARSSAELVLRLSPAQPQAAPTVLTGAQFRVTVDRRRFETDPLAAPAQNLSATPHKLHLVPLRKQPQRETAWHRAAAWTGISAASGGRS